MRVLLAGGGTAGHINPALAIASVIKEHYPDTEFLFVGTPNGMEARLIPEAGYKLEYKNLCITVTKADDIMTHEITVEVKNESRETEETHAE